MVLVLSKIQICTNSALFFYIWWSSVWTVWHIIKKWGYNPLSTPAVSEDLCRQHCPKLVSRVVKCTHLEARITDKLLPTLSVKFNICVLLKRVLDQICLFLFPTCLQNSSLFLPSMLQQMFSNPCKLVKLSHLNIWHKLHQWKQHCEL